MDPHGPQAYFHGPPSEPQKREPIPPSPLGQPMPPNPQGTKSTGNLIHWDTNLQKTNAPGTKAPNPHVGMNAWDQGKKCLSTVN